MHHRLARIRIEGDDGSFERVGERLGLGGDIERETADGHDRGLRDRGAFDIAEPDAAVLRRLVELVHGLATGTPCADGTRRTARRGRGEELDVVVVEVGADVIAGLVVADHRDERCGNPQPTEPDRHVQRRSPDELPHSALVADLVDERVADDDH